MEPKNDNIELDEDAQLRLDRLVEAMVRQDKHGYANSFVIARSPHDIVVVFNWNSHIVAAINMSDSMASELHEALGATLNG